MQKPTRPWMGALAAGLLALPAFGQEKMSETVVATVGETQITLGHVAKAYETLPAQYKSLPPTMLFDGLVDQLVQQEALVQSLGEVPLDVTVQSENQERSILAGHAIDLFMQAPIGEDVLKAAYDERFADAEPAKEWNASHILVETEEEAQALIVELEGGADFATLAQQKSTGPSGPNGGSLGWFGPGRMVPEFEDAVTQLEVGAISAPLQTQFGWHVIKLNEVRNQDVPAFEAVRGELESELQSTALEEHIAKLVEMGQVDRRDLGDLDPSIISAPDFFAK